MESLADLLTEYEAISTLGKVQIWLSIGGITLAGFVSWAISWSKIGRANKIIDGLRAEVQELQKLNTKQINEMHKIRKQKHELEPKGKLETIDQALENGDLRTYTNLMNHLHKSVNQDAIIMTRLARYHTSLIFSMNDDQFIKAKKYAYAAHYLDNSITEAQYLASNLHYLSDEIDKIADMTISDIWDARDSQPELIIAGISHIASNLYGKSLNWIAYSLVDRGYRVAKSAKNLPEAFRGQIAMEMCKAFEGINDEKGLKHCARFELDRLATLNKDSFDHSVFLILKRHFATSLLWSDDPEGAIEILDEIVPKMSADFGEESVSTLVARQMKTNALYKLGNPDLEECRKIAVSFDKTLGPTASHTIISQLQVARCLYKTGKLTLASKLLKRLDRKNRRRLGDHHFIIRQFDDLRCELVRGHDSPAA